MLTLALLPFTTVWEISKLVVRRFAGGSIGAVAWTIRQLVVVAHHVGHVAGNFVVVGASSLWSLLRPLRLILRWCGHGLWVIDAAVGRVLDLAGRRLVKLGRALGHSAASATRR